MLLAYYHPIWAGKWSVDHAQPIVYDGSCDGHRKRIDGAVAAFSAAIGRAPGGAFERVWEDRRFHARS